MSLNIKSEEAHRLARELAALTGESQATAVTIALRERLDRLEGPSPAERVAQLLDLGRDCAWRLREPYRSVDHGDLLYDEKGLPR
jgi:antitoxin VapB